MRITLTERLRRTDRRALLVRLRKREAVEAAEQLRPRATAETLRIHFGFSSRGAGVVVYAGPRTRST